MQKKKSILINESTVKIAGGLIVALDFIEALRNSKDYNITLICPNIKSYRELSVRKIFTPKILLKFYLRFILDFLWIPLIIRKTNPDLIISLGNLPAISKHKQVLFSDNAFLSEKNLLQINIPFDVKIRHIIRRRLFNNRIKYLQYIFVQTEIERKRFLESGISTDILKVIPPLLPRHLYLEGVFNLPVKNKEETIRLVCASNYFQHKNIEVLGEVLKLAYIEGYPLQIIFMLNAKKVKGGKNIIRDLSSLINNNLAINIGNQSPDKIASIVKNSDGLILPSLIETFGLNCLEAWFFKKPYFVSNKPWAHDICGDAAIYFEPTNAKDILSKIKQTFFNTKKLEAIIKSGTNKIDNWPDESNFLAEINRACQ